MEYLSENHLIGQYRVVRLLGQGGMGAVYEAVQDPIGRRVALKVLHAQYARNQEVMNRFFNEARAVNIINHPGLVQVSDFGQAPDGTAYLVMEFLSGETLGDRIRRLGRLPRGEALQIAAQLASALEAAHAHGIVHRDIKPTNILLVPNPAMPSGEQAKIVDFGIAKLLDGNQGGAALTETGKILGTPQYMAPEQARTTRVDGRADVYSVGTLLYEMLSGKLPFPKEADDTAWAVLAKKMADEPVDLALRDPALPKEVTLLVMSLLVREPAARPTMAEVDAALCRLLGLDPKRRSGIHAPVSPEDPPTVSEVKTIDAPEGTAPKQLASPTAPTLGKPIQRSIGLGLLLLLLLVIASAAATTWVVVGDRRSASSPARRDLGLPADLSAAAIPPDLAAPPDLAQPPDLARPAERAKAHCAPRPADASCIVTRMPKPQSQAFEEAMRDNGGVALCPGDRLIVGSFPRRPKVVLPAASFHGRPLELFLFALKGLPTDIGPFPELVELRCPR